jgi:hypothetical protein
MPTRAHPLGGRALTRATRQKGSPIVPTNQPSEGMRIHDSALVHSPLLCKLFGLPHKPTGWGLLFCIDADGRRWTRATNDLSLWDQVLDALDPSLDGFHHQRPGWPGDWHPDGPSIDWRQT